MADLIAELEGVVKQMGFDLPQCYARDQAYEFLRTHHAEIAAAVRDKRLLDAVRDNSWDLRCFDLCGGEDIGWEIVEHHMAEPCERTIAKVYADDPREAIDTAMRAGEGEG